MKIFFPVNDDKGPDSVIVEEFAVASGFYWVQTDTGKSGYVDNECTDDYGKTAAQVLGELGAEAVVVRNIGCAAVNRLRGKSVDAYYADGGSVQENVDKCGAGQLRLIRSGECDNSCK